MSLTRTWYTAADYLIPAQASDTLLRQYLVWGLKALLCQNITTANNGPNGAPPVSVKWTVEGSSNGTTAGMDAVDRWGTTFTAANLVNDGYSDARSWIVLKGPGVTPFYLRIAMQSTSAGTPDYAQVHLAWSNAAFTGGSTTALPTSTKEFGHTTTLTTGAMTFTNATIANVWRLNLVTSAAGHFMFIVCKGGAGISAAHFLAGIWPLRGHVSDAAPYVAVINYNAGNGAARASAAWNIDNFSRNYIDSASVPLQVLYPNVNQTTTPVTDLITSINPMSTKWDEWPTPVVSSAAGTELFRGTLEDIGWLSASAPLAATWPPGGPVERVNIGGMILPFGYALTL